MIDFLNYLSLSASIVLLYCKNRKRKFDFLLSAILLIGLLSAEYPQYSLLISICIVCAYEAVKSFIRNKKISNIIHECYFVVDAIVKVMLLLAFFSPLFVLCFGLQYTDPNYSIWMIPSVFFGSVCLYCFTESESMEHMTRAYLLCKLMLKAMCIFAFLFLLPQINGFVNFNPRINSYIYCMFLVISLLVYFITKQMSNIVKENQEYKEMMISFELMKDMHKEILSLNHLMKDLMDGKEKSADITTLVRLFDEKDKSNLVAIQQLEEIQKISLTEVSNLISFFAVRARSTNIHFYIYVLNKIEHCSIPISQLIKILVSYINNAFKAASMSEKKIVSLYLNQESDGLSIVIENTYDRKSESRKTGMGIEIVDDIKARNKQITSHTGRKMDMYVQELKISN